MDMGRVLTVIEGLAREEGMRFVRKDASPAMRRIAGLLAFVPGMQGERFMESFSTYFGGTLYWARKMDKRTARARARVIIHELVHMRDDGAWFKFSYGGWRLLVGLAMLATLVWAMVQAVQALTGAAPWSPVGLIVSAALALICLPPWPEPGRVHWEARGFTASMWFDALSGVDIWAPGYIARYVDLFTGPDYYWMSWSRARSRDMLERIRDDVVSGRAEERLSVLRDVRDALHREDLK